MSESPVPTQFRPCHPGVVTVGVDSMSEIIAVEEIIFEDACGQNLNNERVSYYFQQGMRHKRINKSPNGTMFEITLPEFTGIRSFSVDNKKPPECRVTQLGIILDGAEVTAENILDSRTWGLGGSARYSFDASWSGRTIYFYHVIKNPAERYANWISALTFYWR